MSKEAVEPVKPRHPVNAGSGVVRRKSICNRETPRIAGLYDLEKTIGQGHFAVVKLARHVFTGEKVAVKVIDKGPLDPLSTTHLMQEVRCMKLVQHPHIVRLYEVIDTNSKLFLILELGDYDMHDFIAKHEKGCPEPLGQQYFAQIITAINYCHKLHVVHRDLKPENVVFFERLGMVKLTDFGFSNLYEPGEQLSTSCGSLAYSAPEILLGDAYDAPAVDVWSLGVILFMLVTGRLPFQETNDSETLTKILDCRYSLPEGLSNACKNLITRMLVRDPAKRASLEEISVSAWVAAGDRGHAEVLPLIVRHHLPDSAHTTIVEQMVNGRVGTEDEICSALENGDYNYLSATYYLLAERVLSSYREQAARSLAEKEAAVEVPDEVAIGPDGDGTIGSSRPSSASRCRSRSNSFRASVRRPCTILKEESEEELSSYLRSSRQSSRFYLSRENSSASSLDGAIIHPSTTNPSQSIPEEDVLSVSPQSLSRPNSTEHLTIPPSPRLRSSTSVFEDLSPIAEGIEGRREESGEKEGMIRELRSESLPFGRIGRGRSRLIRRNSSPSVSMFGGVQRDRVSPQALQDLLELTRLSGRRAASPDSIRSSRSPSPIGSSTSGRTSPSSSMLGRLKGPSVGSSIGSSTTGGGGMRKLSSSPHLLGICEEGEEDIGNSSLLNTSHAETHGVARTNRSASTTEVVFGLHPSVRPSSSSSSTTGPNPLSPLSPPPSFSHSRPSPSSQPPPPRIVTDSKGGLTTYSSVRMIRPRQAVVSPDVCRRYEQHQRFVARSRRSTSCSSSETSDDDERRLTMLSTKQCRRGGGEGKKDDDDDPSNEMGGDGRASEGTNGDKNERGVAGNGEDKSRRTNEGTTTGGKKAKESSCSLEDDLRLGGIVGGGGNGSSSGGSPLTTPLLPIPEMTHLGMDRRVSMRARLLSRSSTAEKVVEEWARGGNVSWKQRGISHLASPPRGEELSASDECVWMRTIQRTRSAEELRRNEDEVEWKESIEPSALPLELSSSLSSSSSPSSSLSSSVNDLFVPSASTDSGLSITRRKKFVRRKRNKNEKSKWSSMEDEEEERKETLEEKKTSIQRRSHLERWMSRLPDGICLSRV